MKELLIPTGLDLAGWAGVLFATLVLIGFGRLLSAGRAAPEAALIAGWGGAALALTLWGVATNSSLRILAVAIALLGVAALVVPRLRLSAAEWRSLARIAALALPLIAVMLSARPSQPDTFLNLLPNAAYLYDHAGFPADDRAAAHSYLPAAPYNLQLASFIASLVTPGFPVNAMIGFNLALQLAAGLLLARLVASAEGSIAAPSWGATAAGLLLATALNPGFVPRFDLAGYGEPAVTVTLAFAGWFAALALERAGGFPVWLMALSLAALVNIKQDAVALVVGVLVTFAVLTRGRRLPALIVAALPAALLYLAWRWFVLSHFAAGELKPLPLASWQLAALPLILWHMAQAAAQKLFLFGALAAAFALLAWRLRRGEQDRATHAAAMLTGVFLCYNAALVFAYVALFAGEMGTDAHSYFRYMTHLSLLLMVAIVLLARGWSWRLGRVAPAVLVILMLLSPVAFWHFLRFDLDVPQERVRLLAYEAARQLGLKDRVLLMLPGDNGSVAAMLETLLRTAPPRRPDLDLGSQANPLPGGGKPDSYDLALLSCVPPGFADAPAGGAALLVRSSVGWVTLKAWPYPAPPPGARWSHILTDAALCL